MARVTASLFFFTRSTTRFCRDKHTQEFVGGGDMLKCYCLLFNKYTMCHLVILPACVPLEEGGGRGGQVEGKAVGRKEEEGGEEREGKVLWEVTCSNVVA